MNFHYIPEEESKKYKLNTCLCFSYSNCWRNIPVSVSDILKKGMRMDIKRINHLIVDGRDYFNSGEKELM